MEHILIPTPNPRTSIRHYCIVFGISFAFLHRKEIAEKLEGKMVYVTVLYETLGTIKKTAKTALE